MPNEDENEVEDVNTPDPAPADSETDDDDPEQNNDPQPTADELQAQLTALQTQLKTVNDESASRRIKLKKLEEKQRKKELSEMDDAERLQAELDDLKSQLTASETQAEQLQT